MVKGVGDCTVCVPDKNNKNCRMYYPISINIVEIETTGRKKDAEVR